MKKIIVILLVFLASNSFAQQQKIDTSNFVLKGKLPDFQLMYKAVSSPDDITPNQKRAVLKFIEELKPEKDSTSKVSK